MEPAAVKAWSERWDAVSRREAAEGSGRPDPRSVQATLGLIELCLAAATPSRTEGRRADEDAVAATWARLRVALVRGE